MTLRVSTQVESTYNKFHVCKAFDVTHFDMFTASETATTHSRGKTLITPKSFRVPPRDISLLRPHQAATDPLPDSLCLAGPDVIGFQSTCGSGPACPPRVAVSGFTPVACPPGFLRRRWHARLLPRPSRPSVPFHLNQVFHKQSPMQCYLFQHNLTIWALPCGCLGHLFEYD